MKKDIPILTHCTIDSIANDAILVDSLSDYIDKHRDMVFPHKHHFYHLVLFTSGSGSHIIDFNSYPVLPLQVYFMAPGQVHTWNFQGDEQGYIINFNRDYFQSLLMKTDYLERFTFLSGYADECIIQLSETDFPQMESLIRQLMQLKKEQVTEDLLRVSLLEILLYFERAQGIKKLTNTANAYNTTLFKNFQKLVDQHYKSKKLPKEYAELLYITPNHLNAICNDYIGRTAGEIIRERVLLEAKRLLVNRSLSISEVANELQFSDNSYFTKFLKKQTGQTPEEFRKQNS